MKSIKLLIIISLINSLPLVGCAPIASSESSANAARSSINSKSSSEKPWVVQTGENPCAVAFSPDGQLAAVANYLDNTMSVYTVDAYTGMFTVLPGSPFATGKKPLALAFSPNGQLIAMVNGGDNTVSVYKVNAMGETLTIEYYTFFKTGYWPSSVAFSPDGKLAAVTNANSETISIYTVDATTGNFEVVLDDNPCETGDSPYSIAFSPNSQWAAVTNAHDNTVSVYKVDTNTGVFTKVTGSPFKTDSYPQSVAFLPSGKFAAVVNGNSHTISVYLVDPKTGSFTQVGNSVATDKVPTSIAFFPNGKFAAVTNNQKNVVSVYNIDADTGLFTSVPGSPFKTDANPLSVAFSPTSALVAIANANANTLGIYELDEHTGRLTPLTGKLLQSVQRKEEFKKTKESFTEFGQQKHVSEKEHPAGLGANIPGPIEEVLGEYIVAPKAVKEVASTTVNAQEIGLQEAIARTQKERKQTELNKTLLFDAIQTGDLKGVQENLTPFTINSINEQRRTPLMEALYYGTPQNNQNKNLIKLLLAYKGIQQDDVYHHQIIRVDTTIGDADGDTALMLAIRRKLFEVGLLIATNMSPEEFKINNKKQETVAQLLVEKKDTYADDENYKALVKLIRDKKVDVDK